MLIDEFGYLGGGHFFTDIVFSGVFMFLLVWAVHGLFMRWRATRLAKGAIEGLLARTGEALYAALGRSRSPQRVVAFTPAELPERVAALPHTAARCADSTATVAPNGESS